MKKSYIISVLVLAIIAIAAVAISRKPSVVPNVSVKDQNDVDSKVIIDEVTSAKPSWLVIQTNEDGVPGPVIGYVKIEAGVNKDVKVKIDKALATQTLHAMIHEDDGVKDKFDFPENDLPLMYKMKMVTKIFKLN